MPTPGKSLVGFMAEAEAIGYLQNICVPPDPNDIVAMRADWQVAAAKLGPAFPNAGKPAVQSIPASHTGYIANLLSQNWMQEAMAGPLLGAQFAMVEIDPLLAFQFHVDSDRSDHHCSPFSTPPTLDELFSACLPLTPVPDPVHIQRERSGGSMLLMSRSLNFQSIQQGFINGGLVGITVGFSLPLAHVVRFNGRCYLHNGFRRTYGARIAGATEIPCVLRDVPDAAAVGIQPVGTFQLQLMESANAPTLAHFTQGRAHDVQLRAFTRTLHVSWAEYVVPAE
jgi:hypothetical protein